MRSDGYTARPALLGTLWRGARRRCPVCGAKGIFSSFLRLRRACDGCRWILQREPGTATGAMYLVAILSQLFALFLLAVLWLATDWAAVLKLTVALPLIAVFSLAALPVSKGIWVAIDFLTDFHTGKTADEDYRARAFEDR